MPRALSLSTLSLTLASYSVSITSTSPACVDHIRVRCEAFVVPSPNALHDEFHITGPADDTDEQSFTVWRQGSALVCEPTAERLARGLEWWLGTEAIARSTDLLHIHGGAVCRDGVAVLLPALSGAGKSTLTLGLTARRFAVLTDDAIFIRPETGSVVPFWRSFHLDLQALLLLRTLGIAWKGKDPRRGSFPPSTFGLTSLPAPAPVRFVFFPDRHGLAPGELIPLSQAEAAVATVPHSAALRRQEPLAMAALATVIGRSRCYRLGTGDLALAIDTVDRVVAGHTPS